MNFTISTDKFKYFEESDFPILVLGIKYDFSFGQYIFEEDFSKDREWLKIGHQTAGIACHQHYIFGTILKPKPKVQKGMVLLAQDWLDSNTGSFGVSLGEILKYRDNIKSLFGVDCNFSYRDFEEAIYPIDCTSENISKLTKDNLPKDLNELVTFKKPLYKSFGCINRWNLWILGENCD